MDINILYEYEKNGWIKSQKHPNLDLWIWNYTPNTQYSKYWTNVTLMCRGLVTNSEGKIIARPFKKFFNYEEYLENSPEMIPNEYFEIFEKMDGSLGILFYYKNEWILTTRGSFNSEQAIKGKEILSKYNLNNLSTDCTYLFEIIYPENRIVVKYDDEKLVLLSIIHTETNVEFSYENIIISTINSFFPLVKRYDGINDYTTLKSMISNDNEGFVIRFKNGFRMKIKGDEYCRLHRILTNISNRDIWKYLKDNKPLDEILEKVPDEFYNWIRNTVRKFEDNFAEILGHVITDYWDIHTMLVNEQLELGNDLVYDEKEYGKRFAEEAFKKKYPHLLFSYRKENINPITTTRAIWDKLYPSYSKPFKNNNDDV